MLPGAAESETGAGSLLYCKGRWRLPCVEAAGSNSPEGCACAACASPMPLQKRVSKG